MAKPNEEIKKEIEQEDNYKYNDELFYTGEGDLLDTPEGRARFCRLNETGIFRKPDNGVWKNYIWVYNVKGEGMTIRKQSRVDPKLMECIDYDADGNQISKSFDPV